MIKRQKAAKTKLLHTFFEMHVILFQISYSILFKLDKHVCWQHVEPFFQCKVYPYCALLFKHALADVQYIQDKYFTLIK